MMGLMIVGYIFSRDGNSQLFCGLRNVSDALRWFFSLDQFVHSLEWPFAGKIVHTDTVPIK